MSQASPAIEEDGGIPWKDDSKLHIVIRINLARRNLIIVSDMAHTRLDAYRCGLMGNDFVNESRATALDYKDAWHDGRIQRHLDAHPSSKQLDDLLQQVCLQLDEAHREVHRLMMRKLFDLHTLQLVRDGLKRVMDLEVEVGECMSMNILGKKGSAPVSRIRILVRNIYLSTCGMVKEVDATGK
jgi:hypothetical protein